MVRNKFDRKTLLFTYYHGEECFPQHSGSVESHLVSVPSPMLKKFKLSYKKREQVKFICASF